MTWWQRNKLGVIFLLPALAMAIAAASFRLVYFYLPYTYWKAHAPEGFKQVYAIDDQRFNVSVSVFLDGVEQSKALEGVEAQPGVELVQVHLTFSAPEDADLPGCEVRMHATDGKEYRPVATKSGNLWSPGARCVSLGAHQRWSLTLLFPVTVGTEASWLEIGWHPPDFIRLPLS